MKAAIPTKQTRRPTIVDVAREAKVGVMTVSRVINNYASVKPETRAKVMKAIAKVGYRPNDAARILKGMQARMIALIIPDLSDFFSTCFHAVQRVAMLHDFQTMVVATGRNAAIEDQQMDSLKSHHIAGAIVVTSGGSSRHMQQLLDGGIPIVALDRPVPGLRADAVLVENREGAALGVQHLIEHGHKSIACVAFDAKVFTVHERIEGYRQAVARAGLKPWIYDEVNSLEEMEQLVAQWTKARNRPTAVFSAQRISSIRLVQALHHHGLRAPGDIAIVGFDDFELAEVLETPLTVVAQSATDMARAATELLFKQIEQAPKANAAQPAKITFPASLIVRSSCGCRPRG